MNRNEEWVIAIAVVAGGLVVCGAVGAAFDHPFIGAALGVALGMTINYQRECPVCMAHMNQLRGAMQ